MHLFVTALFTSFIVTLSLKGLHLFDFIKWHPVSFLKKLEWFEWTAFERWVILFLIIAIVAFLLLVVTQLLVMVPPFLLSVILGVVIAAILEWQILNLPIEWSSFKKFSIPFFVVVVTSMRLIVETARYRTITLFR